MLGIYARTSRHVEDYGTKTIEQQIEAGKDFAKKHNLEYQIFSDEGISGYKITDEEDSKDPYSNRPQFQLLMESIAKGEIDKIWVWEDSRLSRNYYASAFIYHKLNKINIERKKHNKAPIELWIKEKKYDISNPSEKFLKTIMDAFAEYERSLIVSRTSRGLYNAINSGKRSFSHFYGYTKGKRNEFGNFEYHINEFELDNVRKAYEMFKNGKTLREISLALVDEKPDNQKDILKISTKWGRILRHKEYTGYTLNKSGLEIEHLFEVGKKENLNELSDIEKYWVKSKVYPHEIISIAEWIKIREQLQIYKNIRKKYDERNYNAVNTSLSTGLITCNCCGSKYFLYRQKENKNSEKRFEYYKHSGLFNNARCNQHPKTIRKTKIDFILGFFYFYYTLLFDTSNDRKEKAIKDYTKEKKQIEDELNKLNENLVNYNKVIRAIENALEKDPDNYLTHSKRLTSYEEKRNSVASEIKGYQIKLENLKERYSGSMIKKQFANIFEDWKKFYLTDSDEKNRAKLLDIITSNPNENIKNGITIFGLYLVIQTDKIFFVFKIDKNDKTLTPYKYLPIELLVNTDTETEKKFKATFEEIWDRFQSNNLDYKKQETQEFLKNTFKWKNFIVSNENIELDEKIVFPQNSTVIFFDETIPDSVKQQKARERQKRYTEKKKSQKDNSK